MPGSMRGPAGGGAVRPLTVDRLSTCLRLRVKSAPQALRGGGADAVRSDHERRHRQAAPGYPQATWHEPARTGERLRRLALTDPQTGAICPARSGRRGPGGDPARGTWSAAVKGHPPAGSRIPASGVPRDRRSGRMVRLASSSRACGVSLSSAVRAWSSSSAAVARRRFSSTGRISGSAPADRQLRKASRSCAAPRRGW